MEKERATSNIMEAPAYWKEYPDRDIEFVRWYPCSVLPLSEEEVWKKKTLSFYCHIPFCNNNCLSCLYNKFGTKDGFVHQYLETLKKEVLNYASRPYIQDREIIAGYIGGGTPTVLKLEQLKDLLVFLSEHLNIKKGAHLTVETTPLDIDEEKAELLLQHGISRISLGVQSFDGKLLERIGRAQTGDCAKGVIAMLRKAGFKEINIDIMYGLPGETMEMWKDTVEQVLSIPIESISLYFYILIPFSPLYMKIVNGVVPPCPPVEMADEMCNYAVKKLLSSGFTAITTMDFARISPDEKGINFYNLGTEKYRGAVVTSVPRLAYPAHTWYECEEMLAFGSGAYGYLKKHTYLNDPDINEYMRKINGGELPVVMGAEVTSKERIAMSLVYGTKLLKVLRKDFKDRHGVDMLQVYGKQIKQLEEWGLIKMTDEALEVTYPKGWYYMDNISKMFFTPENYKIPQPQITNVSLLKYLKKQKKEV